MKPSERELEDYRDFLELRVEAHMKVLLQNGVNRLVTERLEELFQVFYKEEPKIDFRRYLKN